MHELDAKDREELRPIVLDAQLNYSLGTLVKDSRLVVKGYPSELMQMDFDQQKITPRGYLTDAKYVGESEPGVDFRSSDEANESNRRDL